MDPPPEDFTISASALSGRRGGPLLPAHHPYQRVALFRHDENHGLKKGTEGGIFIGRVIKKMRNSHEYPSPSGV
jgi:hypothetical protein